MADLSGRLSPDRMDDFEEESLDPRIQVELERLNKASEEINKLELELDDARATFRQILSESTQKLNALNKKLGASVEKARPYYDARVKMKDAHVESQKAALRFERACSMHEAAKEMVQLAEQGYMRREQPSDPAWQEMLNHATMKVNDAEKERNDSGAEHMRMTQIYLEADKKVQFLQRDLKRTINKSKPYFEMKAKFNQTMEDQKRSISQLEEEVRSTKNTYSEALKNLEIISEAIHQQRMEKRKQLELGIREAGVGSESPSPPPVRGQGHLVEGKKSVHTSSCQSYAPSSVVMMRRRSSGEVGFKLPSVIHKDVNKARTPSYRSAVDRQDSLADDQSSKATTEENVFSHSSSSQRRHSQAKETMPVVQDKQKKKLQGGLILCINAQMDPLTQQYQTLEMKPTRLPGQKESPNVKRSDDSRLKPPALRPVPSAGVPKNLEFSKNNPFGLPYMKPSSSSSALGSVSTADDKKTSSILLSPTLSIPTPSEAEDNSDAESILSGGPMLDDDQVQFLTMEFSDLVSIDSQKMEEEPQWASNTLPATRHLEQFLHLTKISTSSEDDDPQIRKSEDGGQDSFDDSLPLESVDQFHQEDEKGDNFDTEECDMHDKLVMGNPVQSKDLSGDSELKQVESTRTDIDVTEKMNKTEDGNVSIDTIKNSVKISDNSSEKEIGANGGSEPDLNTHTVQEASTHQCSTFIEETSQ